MGAQVFKQRFDHVCYGRVPNALPQLQTIPRWGREGQYSTEALVVYVMVGLRSSVADECKKKCHVPLSGVGRFSSAFLGGRSWGPRGGVQGCKSAKKIPTPPPPS